MKVLIYSKEKVSTHGVGWFRGWKDISYYKNKFRRVRVNKLLKIGDFKSWKLASLYSDIYSYIWI